MRFSSLIATLAVGIWPVQGAPDVSSSMPLLKLPYGSWKASTYDPKADVYKFRNIRYAAPPVGPLRFAPPRPPRPVPGIQDGSYGPMCVQSLSPLVNTTVEVGEDCLFLDLYVPRKALRSKHTKASVIVWFYGGSYVSGAKDISLSTGMYDGTGLVHQSRGNSIIVTLNYRLGALGGWFGGRTVTKAGASSLGLADQRAALQWVQSYIHLVGGNSTDVTVMGESAGGGSILHHITQMGGRRDPLFHKAILQSSGLNPNSTPDTLETAFQKFAAAAGCPGGNFSCLRSATAEKILSAQEAYQGASFGPVPDGGWIRRNAAFELADGHYWKDLQSVVVTHTKNEAGGFPDEALAQIVDESFDKKTKAGIMKAYPPVGSPGSPYQTDEDRYRNIIGDYLFVCNYRWVADAFAGKSFGGVWSQGEALHGSDVPPTWFNPTLKADGTLSSRTTDERTLYQGYQSYLVSFALAGDVNVHRNKYTTVEWPFTSQERVEKLRALNVTDDGFFVMEDTQGRNSSCDFWLRTLRRLQSGATP